MKMNIYYYIKNRKIIKNKKCEINNFNLCVKYLFLI